MGERLAAAEGQNQERLDATKRENEERLKRTVCENEEQVLRLIQANEVEVTGLITRMWKRAASSGASLNFSAPPQTLPECPVCLEEMGPPTNIFQCTNGHLVCAPCRSSLEAAICPRCRSDITGRATDMEQFLRSICNRS